MKALYVTVVDYDPISKRVEFDTTTHAHRVVFCPDDGETRAEDIFQDVSDLLFTAYVEFDPECPE